MGGGVLKQLSWALTSQTHFRGGLWLEFGERGVCIVPILNMKMVLIKNLGPQQNY